MEKKKSPYARPDDMPQALALEYVSPATRLLEKKRQQFEVQEALDGQMEEYKRHEEAFRRREEALRRKDVELQDSLIKFNKFLQENELKRKRAISRATDERKQIESKDGDIERLGSQYARKISDAVALEKNLQRNKVCHEYLSSVCVHLAEDYHEISDLLNRYATLRGANDDLSQRQKDYEDLSFQQKNEFVKYMKERGNEILNANNEIALLRDKLEQTEATTYRLQADVDSAIRGNSDKTLDLCQILAAVDNLLERFRTHANKHKQQQRADNNNNNSNVGSGNSTSNNGSGLVVATHSSSATTNTSTNATDVKKKKKLPAHKQQPVCRDALEKEGKVAISRLDEIGSYMTDYADIVLKITSTG